MSLTRTDLQTLATVRADDAVLLHEHERYSSAYYLAGYAVEFALKACAAKLLIPHAIPDRDFFNKVFTHDLEKLLGLAELRIELELQKTAFPVFGARWKIVTEWRPEKRYEIITAEDSEAMLDAVCNPKDGVLRWIKTYW